MDPNEAFKAEVQANIEKLGGDEDFRRLSKQWIKESVRRYYSYNFTWLGRPVIQYPQDMIAIQEIIWKVKPDLIIETGVAHGGSLIFSASLLELIGGDGTALGIDIEIRKHNREAIESHPMYKRIQLIEGSSIDATVAARVRSAANGKERVLVILDSNHSHEHVMNEIKLYAPLVTKDSYLIVLDTLVESLTDEYVMKERPWGIGNSPFTAVQEFLTTTSDFVVDKSVDAKLGITVAESGYLKRIS